MVVLWLVSVLFALMSIPMFRGKGGFLGSNQSGTIKDIAEYDEKKISVASGVLCLVIAVLVAGIAYFDEQSFTIGFMAGICVSVLVFLFYAQKKCKK